MQRARRFLFGDSKPFPLNMNFLDLLRDASDACVALLQTDVRAEKAARAKELATTRATTDLNELDGLLKVIDAALGPFLRTGQTALKVREETAQRLLEGNRAAIQQVQQQVVQWRELAVQKAEESIQRPTILGTVEALLVHHELPDTTWAIRWRARGDEQVEIAIEAVTPFTLTARFGADLPSEHAWRRAVRVGSLVEKLAVPAERTGILGTRMGSAQLERFLICDAECSPRGGRVVMRKSFKDNAPGFVLVFSGAPADRQVRVAALPLNDETPDPADLTGEEASAACVLWDAVESTLTSLVQHRTPLQAASYDGSPLADLPHPGELAQTLIQVLAPLARELRERSTVKGELNLKVEVEDGKREELFIREEEISSKFATLPTSHRIHFKRWGLVEPQVQASEPGKNAEPFHEPPVTNADFDYEVLSGTDFDYEPVSEADLGLTTTGSEIQQEAPAPETQSDLPEEDAREPEFSASHLPETVTQQVEPSSTTAESSVNSLPSQETSTATGGPPGEPEASSVAPGRSTDGAEELPDFSALIVSESAIEAEFHLEHSDSEEADAPEAGEPAAPGVPPESGQEEADSTEEENPALGLLLP